MEEAPCKDCLVLPICKNRHKDFVLEKLYRECSLLRTYILQNSGLPVSGIYNNTLDKLKLVRRLANVKKYIPGSAGWVVTARQGKISINPRTNK